MDKMKKIREKEEKIDMLETMVEQIVNSDVEFILLKHRVDAYYAEKQKQTDKMKAEMFEKQCEEKDRQLLEKDCAFAEVRQKMAYTVSNLHANGFSIEDIMKFTGLKLDEIETIILFI